MPKRKSGAAEYSFNWGIEGLRRAAQNAEEASASEAQAPTKARQHITSAGKQIFTYGT